MTEERKIQKVRWAREHAHRVCLRDREGEEIRKGGREKRKGKIQRMTQLVKSSECKNKT